MKNNACATLLLIAAALALPGLNLAAQNAEGTLDKISRTGEFVIGYRADSSPLASRPVSATRKLEQNSYA
jgi:ABC-type amino acid transport substrate-binding protein